MLEFLSSSEYVDGKSDPRLEGLFERILKQRQPVRPLLTVPLRHNKKSTAARIHGGHRPALSGLIRYFELTGDARALEAAEGLAKRLWSFRDDWQRHLRATSARGMEAWVSEPMAQLYAITKDQRWLEFCGMVRENLGTCEVSCHAHGFMSTLRGLQVAALATGDRSWNDKPELNRRLIIERRFEMPDDCTPEVFPRSARNEGCSIADWMRLNLNAGLILDDDAAYDKAERIFWNALAFNQWITGAFGCREMTANGYGIDLLQEAWFCCVHHAGTAMTEYARHVVTCREGAIRVNFLVPGDYAVPLPGGHEAKVRISTAYPSQAEAAIEVTGAPAATKVRVRVPACVRNAEVSESRSGEKVQLVFKGRLGHRVEEWGFGVVLTYGPLVLVPASCGFGSVKLTEAERQEGRSGYFAESLPAAVPALKLDRNPDGEGFLPLEAGPVPDWSYWDEGPQSRTWVPGAVATVPVQLSSGEITPLRFTPMCYNTSCLALYETPVLFRRG